MKNTKTGIDKIVHEVETAVIGKGEVLRKLLAAVLCGGHVLFEDYPGLAKTLMANSLARALGIEFRRIQFTPDLLPGDITGGYVFDRESGRFDLRKGPIFTNVLLADEINRASPKTQSALLEAMQEGQVTIEGDSFPLPRPFLVIATQNPVEYEGTFPLPEAQLDRFMIRLAMGYPEPDDEKEILSRRRTRRRDEVEIRRVVEAEELSGLSERVENVHLDDDLEDYIVRIISATRKDQRIRVGSSPRGSLALMRLAMAQAMMDGRDYVLPDDIKGFAVAALAHRVMLEPDYWMRENAAQDIISGIVNQVPVPVRQEQR